MSSLVFFRCMCIESFARFQVFLLDSSYCRSFGLNQCQHAAHIQSVFLGILHIGLFDSRRSTQFLLRICASWFSWLSWFSSSFVLCITSIRNALSCCFSLYGTTIKIAVWIILNILWFWRIISTLVINRHCIPLSSMIYWNLWSSQRRDAILCDYWNTYATIWSQPGMLFCIECVGKFLPKHWNT